MFIEEYRFWNMLTNSEIPISSNFDAKIHKCLYFLHKSLDIHVDYAIFAQIYLK
ncbi:MAG: hypothetical protein H6Q14_2411 [Bacteroidetes bacterium]|jgi:hypothetical protein|nr:hypothetical protein [Bacteroidota bacterium]